MSSKQNKSKLYGNKQLEQAITEVKAGKPVKTTAMKYNIPRTTLLYKSRGKFSSKIEKRGPKCILGQDNERCLVDWIFYMKNHGFPVTKLQVFSSVRMLLNTMKRKTIFPNNIPGRHWYEAFCRRHPEIRDKVTKNQTKSRAAVSEEKIRAWFKEASDHLKLLGLLDIDDSRKLNLDESSFKLNPTCKSVLAPKGDKTVYYIVGNDEKECLTTLICGNAAGQLLPPMVLFPYKRIPRYIVSSMPNDWAIGCSDNGWMTSESFYEYIANVLYPWLVKSKIQFPVILYLDGRASHLSYPLTKFCREKKIELIALYPNATHILHPLDVALFHPLKIAWSTEVRNWRMENNGESLKCKNFAPLLKKSLASLKIKEILQNGFESTGLHPFSPDAIDYKKHLKSFGPESTVEAEPTKNFDKAIENLRLIESNIEYKLLEQFKCQEKCAQWNGNVENTSLFLFWHKIKKITTSPDLSTNNTAPTEDKGLKSEERGEINDSILEPQPSQEVIVYAANDDGNLIPVIDNTDLILVKHELMEVTSANEIEEPTCSQVSSGEIVNESSPPNTRTMLPNVPSSFKNALLWPSKDKELKKRKVKEKVPTVYTSDTWLQYYESKETKKRKLEEEKELKKAERVKNKVIKEAEKIIKMEKLEEK